MSTYHITAKVKRRIDGTSGMRLSGTAAAISSAGTFNANFINPDNPLNAGHSIGLVDPPASYVSIVTHGAINDGTTDNIIAIRNAISAGLAASLPIFVPAGAWAYSGNISVSAAELVGVGPTSELRALDWTNRAIWLLGDGPGISNVKLTTVGVVNRQAPWEYVGVVMFGCTNFTIHNVYLKNNGAGGFQTALSAGPGIITNNTLSGTLADSIHMTDEAHDIVVKLNRIENSGDDGIACVSYAVDGGVVKNIEASYNWVKNNLWGRCMSVVGGQDINYHNNLVQDNADWAGFYIAQENGFATFGCLSVSVTFNTIINCGSNATGHAGIMLFSDGTYTNSSIAVVRNDIQQDGTENGIRLFGPQLSVSLNENKISSASASYVNNVTTGVTTVVYSSGNVGYEFSAP